MFGWWYLTLLRNGKYGGLGEGGSGMESGTFLPTGKDLLTEIEVM